MMVNIINEVSNINVNVNVSLNDIIDDHDLSDENMDIFVDHEEEDEYVDEGFC